MIGSKPEKVSLLTMRFLTGAVPLSWWCVTMMAYMRVCKLTPWSPRARRILKGAGYPPSVTDGEADPQSQGLFQDHAANQPPAGVATLLPQPVQCAPVPSTWLTLDKCQESEWVDIAVCFGRYLLSLQSTSTKELMAADFKPHLMIEISLLFFFYTVFCCHKINVNLLSF